MPKDYVAGEKRDQSILFPETFDEYIPEENPVRFNFAGENPKEKRLRLASKGTSIRIILTQRISNFDRSSLR